MNTTLTLGRVLKDIALALSKKGFTTLSFGPSISEELPTWQPSQYSFTFGSLPEQCELTILEPEAEVLSALPDAPPNAYEDRAEIGCIYVNEEPYTVSITTIPRVLCTANTLTIKPLFILDLTSRSDKDDISATFRDFESLMADIEDHIATKDTNHIAIEDTNHNMPGIAIGSDIDMMIPQRPDTPDWPQRRNPNPHRDPRDNFERPPRPRPTPTHRPPIGNTGIPHDLSSTMSIPPYEQGESQ